ncbi:hypothetical protein [Isoptericola cucumis]|uniref:Membrane protein DedA with SNARE-associated domain n=1 Tax=Isoptericola cucumis TaxID=1776856 RepID=A0ABQ2BCT0_9MICO|nr:hypothetical protein [Isoptericola cucumis]GGI11415.1 hypothetical protein GCM10007368_36080 [Isoptericola cucumis]
MTSAPAKADDTPRPPGTAARVLRPFGYLLVGLVWTVIALVVLGLGPGILVFVAVDGTMELGGIWAGLVEQPSEMVAFLLVIPLVVVLWGPGVLWYLPAASWPLALLSYVYVGRSLSPGFAQERLSRTTRVGRGRTIGLPTVGGVALSLQPVRESAVTRFLMRFYVSGWLPDGHMFLAMLPAGGGWLLALVGLARDVPAGARVVLLVVAAALVAWSVVLGRRAWRRRFDGEPATTERGSVTDLSPSERKARRAELTARRDARLRRSSGR